MPLKKSSYYSFLKLIVVFSFVFFLPFHVSFAKCIFADDENYHIEDMYGEVITPIYRLYNTSTGMHVYTRGTNESNLTLGKWAEFRYADPAPSFCAELEQKEGLTPIYRVYNKNTGAHVYTRGEAERDLTLSKWNEYIYTDGTPAFWASLVSQTGLTPIYRVYNKNTGGHVYTRGEAERDLTLSMWSEYTFTDGVPAFYAHITNDSGSELFSYQGPEISVGVWSYSRDDIRSSGEPFKIDANKNYVVKNADGNTIFSMQSNHQTRVIYAGDGSLQVYSNDAGVPLTNVGYKVSFEAADGVNSDIIFDAHRPSVPTPEYDDYNHYRGKIELRYSDNYKNNEILSAGDKRIWVINKLPLEHYTWGMAELNLANVTEHNKVMVSIFRTYGKRKIEAITYYNDLGFDVVSTPSSQKYNGYDYEITHPTIKEAAIDTRGSIITYQGKTALTAYSSWSDGTTRAIDLSLYPYLKPVSDPYGDYNGDYWNNSYKSSEQLVSEGNHMKGLIAHGSVTLAYDLGWNWQNILKYYYTGIDITTSY